MVFENRKIMTVKLKQQIRKISLFFAILAIGILMYTLKDYQNKKYMAKVEAEKQSNSFSRGTSFSFSKK